MINLITRESILRDCRKFVPTLPVEGSEEGAGFTQNPYSLSDFKSRKIYDLLY